MAIQFSDALKTQRLKILVEDMKEKGISNLYLDGVISLPKVLGKDETFTLNAGIEGLDVEVRVTHEELIKTNEPLDSLLANKLVQEMDYQMASINLKPIKITENTDSLSSTYGSTDNWNKTYSSPYVSSESAEYTLSGLTINPSFINSGTIVTSPRPWPGISYYDPTTTTNIHYDPNYDVFHRGTATATTGIAQIPLTQEYLKDLIEKEKYSLKLDLIKDSTLNKEAVQKFIQEYGPIVKPPPLEAMEELRKPEKKQPPAEPSPQLELF